MYSFKNDYSEGAPIQILQKLIDTNFVQQQGYGEDDYSKQAKELLRLKLNNPNASIYFLSGGTQSNLIVIASLLRLHEAVISAKTGHIYANETGAIEATGHRIITIETDNGKLNSSAIEKVLSEYTLRPHVVKPRMVYISNSTEIGTVYSKEELKELSTFCRANNLLLYLDGARLGPAIMALNNDLTMEDISDYIDVCYLGGTKNGALFGEAVVFNRAILAEDFDYVLKQKGALLAKGRVLGIQFAELFRNDLYFELAKHANQMAQKIAQEFADCGFSFLTQSPTNQIFPILPNKLIDKLRVKYDFYNWKSIDKNHDAIRIITSWATPENIVNEIIKDIRHFSSSL